MKVSRGGVSKDKESLKDHKESQGSEIGLKKESVKNETVREFQESNKVSKQETPES